MAPPSLRALYRLQLATARHFDAQPALKALLSLLGGGDAAVAAQLRRFLGDAEGGGGAPAPYAPPRSLAALHLSGARATYPCLAAILARRPARRNRTLAAGLAHSPGP
jgi:hypothetical protein